MKNTFLFLISFSVLYSCQNGPKAELILSKKGIPALIPQPLDLDLGESSFSFTNSTEFHFPESLKQKEIFSSVLSDIQSLFEKKGGKNKISFLLTDSSNENTEAYSLIIKSNSVEISSDNEVGLFWGLQTFRQLCFQYSESLAGLAIIPEMEIKDKPKFQHRGMLLDVCRHFFDKDVVKKYIDLLSYYKMNVLHWHLTEDQGWRIEIDKYPRLTEISAWRKDSSGEKYGGFYSKETIREIVKYASDRNITIIPEIELPGHSQAAVAAYPWLSCTGDSVEVINDWGVFKEIYCAGNDSTFHFIENVLLEVIALFPSKYIHIGGDEAPKFRWENCSKCQKRMLDHGLKDEHELQSYFIKRVEKFLTKNGRELIGWDEILEGGLSPNATVQSWRGMEHGKTAADENHKVIMSPTSHCYFDYNLKSIDLEKVYNFNPIPEGLAEDKRKYIIGGECNMWTERVPTEANLDSKVFPRLLAMTEVLWSYPTKRDFPKFYNKVQRHYSFLDSRNVAYGLEAQAASIVPVVKNDQTKIELLSSLPDLELSYRKNDSDDFNLYTKPINLNFTGKIQVQAKKNGENYGGVLNQNVQEHKALNSTSQYVSPYNSWYEAGGDQALVNGFLGSEDFRDGNWQGFYGDDVEVILELRHTSKISDVWLNFFQYNNAWIFLPTEIEIYTSIDGEIWTKQAFEKIKDKSKTRGQFIESVNLLIYPEVEAKHLKIKAKNLGTVPDWHEAAGSKAWIFIDEIIVQ